MSTIFGSPIGYLITRSDRKYLERRFSPSTSKPRPLKTSHPTSAQALMALDRSMCLRWDNLCSPRGCTGNIARP